MCKKLIANRMVRNNQIMQHAVEKLKLYPPESPNYQIAKNTIMQMEAVIAELLIIQNELSLLNFLKR